MDAVIDIAKMPGMVGKKLLVLDYRHIRHQGPGCVLSSFPPFFGSPKQPPTKTPDKILGGDWGTERWGCSMTKERWGSSAQKNVTVLSETKIGLEKWMGWKTTFPFWDGFLGGAMLVSGSVDRRLFFHREGKRNLEFFRAANAPALPTRTFSTKFWITVRYKNHQRFYHTFRRLAFWGSIVPQPLLFTHHKKVIPTFLRNLPWWNRHVSGSFR